VATEIPGNDGFREFGLRLCDGGRRSESFGISEAAPLIKRSSASVVVGVIDGPVALEHADLAVANIREASGTRGACANISSTAWFHATFVAGILCAKRTNN
jgi:hypothetical protein